MSQDSSSQNSNRFGNRLLEALPVEEYQRLLPHLEVVSLVNREILHVPGEPIEYVYFPGQALVSLVSVLESGSTVELSLIGKEGMVGIQAFLGTRAMPHQAIVQVVGDGVRMPVSPFQTECNRRGTLQHLLLCYTRFLLIETAQRTACNATHTIEERLARWLLEVGDRLGSDELPLTQELIAQMLGVRRAGVTVTAGTFQQAGMIRYRRGEITILNRENLEATTCECYQIIKTELDRLLNIEYS